VVVAATVLFSERIWVLAIKVHTSISLGLRVTKLFTYNEGLEVSAKGISSPSSFWCFCWTGFCKGSELFTETETRGRARARGKDDCSIVSVENALKSNNQVCSNSLLLRVSGILGEWETEGNRVGREAES
jgi:hypothetical protein